VDVRQKYIVIGYASLALLLFVKGVFESIRKKNPYVETPFLFWMGIFVWGDAVVFGLFWFLTSLFFYLLGDWMLFLLFVSIFWIVRSVGETIYWINQQYSDINRNPPERLRGYRFFGNDSIWFIYQITWQCIVIISVITTIYFANLWLKNM